MQSTATNAYLFSFTLTLEVNEQGCQDKVIETD